MNEAIDDGMLVARLNPPSPDLTITRFAYSPMGTFGSLTLPNGIILYTVERPWLDNKPAISCIPCGTYECVPRRFFRGGYNAIEITNVAGRSHILIHIANTMNDVEGCIGVGSKLGMIGNTWAVLQSKAAFDLLMRHFEKRNFTLKLGQFAALELGHLEGAKTQHHQ